MRQTEDIHLPDLQQIKDELERNSAVYFRDAEHKEPTKLTAPGCDVMLVLDGLHIREWLLQDQGTDELVGFADSEDPALCGRQPQPS